MSKYVSPSFPRLLGFAPGLLALLLTSATVPARAPAREVPENLAQVIERALAEEDYSAVWQVGVPSPTVDGAWQATNSAHHFRTFFYEHGVRVEPQRTDSIRWSFGMALGQLARGGESFEPELRAVNAEGNRIEYDRGDIVEWYLNDERGLEQGFNLAKRPLAEREGLLELVLDIHGDLSFQIHDEGKRVQIFGGKEKPSLSLGGLYAHDSAGRALETFFAVRGENLIIEVDDEEASYPIVVDPTLIHEEATFEAINEVDAARFGTSIDIDGELAIVGSNGPGAGVAYVFERNSAGTWIYKAKLYADLAESDLNFGTDVAITATHALVGAPGDSDAEFRSGAVYSYERQANGTYFIPQKLLSANPDFEGSFGASLDATAAKLVVGAPFEDNGSIRQAGAVHAYQLFDGSWTHRQHLLPGSSERDTNFGTSVAIDDTTMIVGSPGEEHSNGTGVVQVFTGFASGTYLNIGELKVAGTEDLGFSVDVDGDSIVAGAPWTDFAGRSDCGAVAYFSRATGPWLHLDTQFGLGEGDRRGWSVAVDEDDLGVARVAVGEPGRASRSGAALMFRSIGGGLIFERLLTAPSFDVRAELGESVAIDDGFLLVGAPEARIGSDRPGRVVAYQLESQGWTSRGSIKGRDRDHAERFGRSVDIVGNMAVVGASQDKDRAFNAGGVWIFEEEDGTWSLTAKLSSGSSAVSGGRFGRAVATDGTRIVVGAPYEFVGGIKSGAAYIFQRNFVGNFGSGSRLTPPDPFEGMEFGKAVDLAQGKVVVGAPSTYEDEKGAVYVYGFNIVWSMEQKITQIGATFGDHLGTSIDFDGTDLFIGIPEDGVVAPGGGAVMHCRLNSLGAYVAVNEIAPEALAEGANFGHSLGRSGDWLVVGAPGDRSAFVYERTLEFTFSPHSVIEGDVTDFGRKVAVDQDLIAVGGGSYAAAFARAGAFWIETELRPSDGEFTVGPNVKSVPVAVSEGRVLVGHPAQDVERNQEGKAFLFRPDLPGAIVPYGFSTYDCPCDNYDIGNHAGCLNSTGFGGRLEGYGSARAAPLDLRMKATGLIPGKNAMLFVGSRFGSGIPFGDGMRVAMGQIRRLGLRQVSSAGEAEWEALPLTVEVGELRYFQVMYRDNASSPCGSRFNLTNGVQVEFQP